ncbi:MAG: polyprenyl synthetase family protein [Candidatus Aminicenantia bacterium]
MEAEIKKYVEKIKNIFERKIEEFLSEQTSTLYDSMRYSVMSGGKRYRPLLLISIGESLGASLENLLYPACALEFIHTSTLIHDDLPFLDNDDWRRGKPSNQKVFGEGVALLAGDYLLALAFSVLSHFPEKKELEGIKLKAISMLGEELKNLIKGQSFELSITSPSEDEILYLYILKTGSLMSASCGLAGIFANADEKTISTLRSCGSNLGLAFQITDDILDLFHDQKKNSQPLNYAYLFGYENARTKAFHFRDKALEEIKSIGIKSPIVEYLVNLAVERSV